MKKVVLTLTMLLGMMFLTACGKTKIDLADYCDITYSGLNGQATADCDIRFGDLEEVLSEGKDDDDLELIQMLVAIEDSIEVSIDKEEDISNGDKITASITWDADVAKQYDLKFTGDEKTVEVSGLSDGTVVDLFQDISLEYSGVAPEAQVTICNTSDDTFLKTVSYSADNSYDLSNGDTITVTASYSEATALEYEYLINETEKTYTIEGIDEYISTYDEIDDETLTKMKDQATDLIESGLASSWYYNDYMYPDGGTYESDISSVKVQSIELTNSYFFCLKDGMEMGWNDVYNSLFLVYKVVTKDSQSPKGVTSYITVYYKNFIKRDTGAIDVVITDGYISEAYSNTDNLYREVVSENKAKYTFEEITY